MRSVESNTIRNPFLFLRDTELFLKQDKRLNRIEGKCDRITSNNAVAMSQNFKRTQQLFIYLGGKKTSGKSPDKWLTANQRAAGATSSLLVVQMVQIRGCLQLLNMSGR